MSPSLTERVPADAALAAILVVALAGGGAMATMAVGPDNEPQQNNTASPTPTETPAITVPAVPATPTDAETPTDTETPTETVPPYTDWPGTDSPSAVAPPTTEPGDPPTPVAELCHTAPASGTPGEPVVFYARGSNAVHHEWQFITGQTGYGDTESGVEIGNRTGQRVEFAFPAYGTYNVTLTVTGDDGQTATATREVYIRWPSTWTCPSE